LHSKHQQADWSFYEYAEIGFSTLGKSDDCPTSQLKFPSALTCRRHYNGQDFRPAGLRGRAIPERSTISAQGQSTTYKRFGSEWLACRTSGGPAAAMDSTITLDGQRCEEFRFSVVLNLARIAKAAWQILLRSW